MAKNVGLNWRSHAEFRVCGEDREDVQGKARLLGVPLSNVLFPHFVGKVFDVRLRRCRILETAAGGLGVVIILLVFLFRDLRWRGDAPMRTPAVLVLAGRWATTCDV